MSSEKSKNLKNKNDVDFYIDTVFENPIVFNCGSQIYNDYLLKKSDSSVIHYVINDKNEELIGYFSLLAGAVLFGSLGALNSIPAIEIRMYALDKKYQGLGLSERIINAALIAIQEYVAEYLGANIILLYSVPDKVKIYKSCGFKLLDDDSFFTYNSLLNQGCIPMYKNVFD